jgi:hypothetical protein
MSSVAYKVDTSAAVALTAATARTALMMITPAQFGMCLTHFTIGFDGVTASAVPVFWEIVRSTNATNSTPGTNNTTETANIVQVRGRSITTGFTAFSASTAGNEPTVLTRLDGDNLTPNGGLLVYDFPLGREFEADVSAGLGIRLTAPASVNARCSLVVERL